MCHRAIAIDGLDPAWRDWIGWHNERRIDIWNVDRAGSSQITGIKIRNTKRISGIAYTSGVILGREPAAAIGIYP